MSRNDIIRLRFCIRVHVEAFYHKYGNDNVIVHCGGLC